MSITSRELTVLKEGKGPVLQLRLPFNPETERRNLRSQQEAYARKIIDFPEYKKGGLVSTTLLQLYNYNSKRNARSFAALDALTLRTYREEEIGNTRDINIALNTLALHGLISLRYDYNGRATIELREVGLLAVQFLQDRETGLLESATIRR